jgi:mevalonate kinase
MAAKEYRANGKLLITAEYLVLEGAKALAQPLSLGQRLKITEGRGSEIKWSSVDNKGKEWFSANFSLWDFKAEKTSDPALAEKMTQLLKWAVRINSEFLSKWVGVKAEAKLDFDINWGLGSSSTLVDLVAQWADIDPFELLGETFGGSGYDVACARAQKAIVYQLEDDMADFEEVDWQPAFKDHLYFLYTGQKQSSAEEVEKFKKRKVKNGDIDKATEFTYQFLQAKTLKEFQDLMKEHEKFIGDLVDKKCLKPQYFSDFDGEIKSLGAWGGDFAMIASERDISYIGDYFTAKGLGVLQKWKNFIV